MQKIFFHISGKLVEEVVRVKDFWNYARVTHIEEKQILLLEKLVPVYRARFTC